MKVETQSSTIPAADLLNDLRLLVEESEKIASQPQDRSPEEVLTDLRARVEVAEERLACYAQTHGLAKFRATEGVEEIVRSNPGQSLMLAFGIGAVAGWLVGRRVTFISPRA